MIKVIKIRQLLCILLGHIEHGYNCFLHFWIISRAPSRCNPFIGLHLEKTIQDYFEVFLSTVFTRMHNLLGRGEPFSYMHGYRLETTVSTFVRFLF